MSEFGAIKKRVRNSALNELEQARAELHNEERSMNQRNKAIIDAWIRLYICITTNDINEFYKALSGNVPRKGPNKYRLWETVNKSYEKNRK